MAFVAVESLILDMVLVWMYAAILPRMKKEPKTAIIVALIVWLLMYFSANAAMVAYGFMPVKVTVIGSGWGHVELLAAA